MMAVYKDETGTTATECNGTTYFSHYSFTNTSEPEPEIEYVIPDKPRYKRILKSGFAQEGYTQARYFRRTTRSTIAPRRYASWKGGR